MDQHTQARPCSVDNRHHLAEDEPAVCRACVGKTRADLHAIVNLYAELPGLMADAALGSNAPRRNPARSDEPGLIGGRFLVFLGGGSASMNAMRRKDAYDAKDTAAPGLRQFQDPHSTEPEWGTDDRPDDPCSVAWELGRAEDDWRKTMRMEAAPCGYWVGPAAAFLHLHLQWAANHHPGFPDFAEDIRQLRHALEAATGTNNPAVKAEAPCIDCGNQLVRHYRDAAWQYDPTEPAEDRQGRETWGLEDDWMCKGCKRVYDAAGYRLAVAALADTDEVAGPWIPIAQAAQEAGVPYRTVQTWQRRERIAHRKHPTTGAVEVRQRQVRELARDRPAKAG